MKPASLLLASCCFLAFMVGSQVVFRRQRETTRHLLLLTIAAPLSAVAEVMVMAATPSPPAFRYAIGMALFGASLGLFLWTAYTTRREKFTVAFSTDQPRFLVDRGPYALVRHPFYVAYLTAYVAGLVMTNSPWPALVVLAMAALYGHAAIVEERKFGRSGLCGSYDSYRTHTRMFIPVPRRRTNLSGHRQ